MFMEMEIEEGMKNSFGDYFLQIHKEIPGCYMNFNYLREQNIKRYKSKENTENEEINKLLPINIINHENFFEVYINYIKSIHTKPNKIPHFIIFEQNECQLLYLLQYMSFAENKMKIYQNNNNADLNTNNHLIKINNIIKNSPTLIGYLYILKWIQKIITEDLVEFSEDENMYKLINNKEIIDENNEEKKSDPLYLEQKCKSNDEEYQNFMKQFSYCFFKGDLLEAQEMCDIRGIKELSNIFGGGCPIFDSNLCSNNDDLALYDQDLMPPTMKNKDHKEILDYKMKMEEDQEDIINNKKVYGNSLYILWFKVMYENVNYSDNNSIINYLFRLVSGNYKNYELKDNNVYEYLFINVLHLFHSELFYQLTKNPNNRMIQYHYIEPESFKEISELINSGGRKIINIIDTIFQNENFNKLIKKNIYLEFELSFIKLFFIKIELYYNNNINNTELVKNYIDNLVSILNIMKTGYNVPINFDLNDIFDQEREFNYKSLEERQKQKREYYDMINICTYRAFFSCLTCFFSINHSFFDDLVLNNKNELEDKIELIYNMFDDVYCNYIKHLININEKIELDLIVYITTYMFNIRNIYCILVEVSHHIKNSEKYQKLISLIKQYFQIRYKDENLSFYIIKEITSKSNLLEIGENQKMNFLSIDDALNYYVDKKLESSGNMNDESFLGEEISADDLYKINQVSCLFDKSKNDQLNLNTSYSYLLKLIIKFLTNYKYKEAYELKYQLNDYFYDNDKKTDELIIEDFSEIENNINKLNHDDDILFLIILISKYFIITIINCFFSYANDIYFPYKKIQISENKYNKNSKNFKEKELFTKQKEELNKIAIDFINRKLFYLNGFIKIIVGNKQIFNYMMDYYGLDTNNEFKKLLGDWAFQTIKWTSDMFELHIIDMNTNDNLEYIFDKVIYNEGMLNKYYLMNNFNNGNYGNIHDREQNFYDIMTQEQKQKVIEILYKMTKRNKYILDEILDDDLLSKLKEQEKDIIQDLDFSFE